MISPCAAVATHPHENRYCYLVVPLSNCYLAKAEHRLGNNEQAWSWLKLAEKACEQVPELSEMFACVKQELSESLN
ncbi:MAG TPA: hypothetical protein VKS99_05190 [Blastocatellia bacterium]|nr:hypothetical protein [Blastocatellia bacterium]